MENDSALETPTFGSGMEYDSHGFPTICAAVAMEPTNETVLPPSVAIGNRTFQIIYGLLQVALGSVLNTLVLLLVYKFKKLRNISFSIAVQISVVNLMLVGTHSLPAVVNRIAGLWILGVEFCVASGLSTFMLGTLRTILIFVFSFDRFATVFVPFSYPRFRQKLMVLMCTLAWLASAALSLVGVPHILDCYLFSDPVLSCVFSPRCGPNCSILFNVWLAAVIIPSIIAPVGIFLALYIKGRLMRRNNSKMLGVSTKTFSASERRSLNTFFLLFLAVFVVTVLPILLLNISRSIGEVERILLVQLGNYVVTLLVITDPVVIMRNTDVRESFNQLLKSGLRHFRESPLTKRRRSAGTCQKSDIEVAERKDSC